MNCVVTWVAVPLGFGPPKVVGPSLGCLPGSVAYTVAYKWLTHMIVDNAVDFFILT